MPDFNYKKKGFNHVLYYSKNSTQHDKKSPVEDDDIEIVGRRPAISRKVSPIGRQVKFPQAGQ